MSGNSSDFMLDFVPKTDGTFIAPNENFNSFTQSFSNSSGLKTKDDEKTKPEDDNKSAQSSADPASKRKAESSTKKSDKFIDFIVNQYKSDGFLCTLDENERQIYYCYYCHQYIIDFDLIPTHIDSSKHMMNVLNGISFDRGLDKEFVIESISEKKPKNIQKLIFKELARMPLHLKHYYYRNNIRIMDLMPPNAYFCKSCSESIPSFKSIESHMLSEKHISSQQKPSLMEMIDKSDDLVLKFGLEFITEEKISDSSHVVYECELCNCFDCDFHKMFSHIKSRDHRINLMKRYDYETNDFTDDELEKLIKEMHEKHGSGLMKITKTNKKLKTRSNTPSVNSNTSNASNPLTPSTPTTGSLIVSDYPNVPNNPNSPHIHTPDSESMEPLNQVFYSLIEKENVFLREDKFLANFEDHKIIETYESDGREMYYCCLCDEYFNSFNSVERHIDHKIHKNSLSNKTKWFDSFKGLNQKFLMKKISDSSLDSTNSDLSIIECIPILTKHFYFKRGIKYLFEDKFFCRFCQIRIDSFYAIETHFESESHKRIEEIPTKFNDLLFQTNQPIIGLKYIRELINDKSKHILYECILCDYKQDFCQMFLHLNCFSHQFRVLKRLSPNNRVFKCVKENEVSLKSSELLKIEISKIEEEMGCGFVTKSIANSSPKEPEKSSESHSDIPKEDKRVTTKSFPKTTVCEPVVEPSDSPVIKSEITDEIQVKIESLPDIKTEMKPIIHLTKEDLLLSVQSLFAVQLQNEDEASSLVAIIESLKDSLIKYYNEIPVIPKQLQAFVRTKTVTTDQSESAQTNDNYEICQMDEG